jgi:hypothetical protein
MMGQSLLLFHVVYTISIVIVQEIAIAASATTTVSSSVRHSYNKNIKLNRRNKHFLCWGFVSRGGGAASAGANHGDDDDDGEFDEDHTSTISSKPKKVPSGGRTSTTSNESKYSTQLELVKEQVLASTMPEVRNKNRKVLKHGMSHW